MNAIALSTRRKYWAFISYSHQDNLRTRGDGSTDHVQWANWLHEQLETFRVPEAYRKSSAANGEPMPERFFPTFRDEAELPSSHNLGAQIRSALAASRFLIVIASPRSARSQYVNEEVRLFRALGGGERIFTLIVDGEPNLRLRPKAGWSPDEECFCPALVHPLDRNGHLDEERVLTEETIAADVRLKLAAKPREIRHSEHQQEHPRELLEVMKLKLMAGLMGVGLDDLVQRDQARQQQEAENRARKTRRLVAAFVALVLVAVLAGVIAQKERNAARQVNAVASAAKAAADDAKRDAEWAEQRAVASRAEATRAALASNEERAAAFSSTLKWLTDDGFYPGPAKAIQVEPGQGDEILLPVSPGFDYAFLIDHGLQEGFDVAFEVRDEAGNLLNSSGPAYCRWFHTRPKSNGMVSVSYQNLKAAGEFKFYALRRTDPPGQ